MKAKKYKKSSQHSNKIIIILVLLAIVAGSLIFFLKSKFVNVTHADTQNLSYVALGDSITLAPQPGITGFVYLYQGFINSDLGLTVNLTNLGINSLSSTQLLDKLKTDNNFIQNATNANFVSLIIGANDFWTPRLSYLSNNCGGADNQDCLRTMVTTYKSNFDQIMLQIRALNVNPVINLRVGDIYYYLIADDIKSGAVTVLNSYLGQMNDYIHQKASVYNYSVANVHTAFNGQSGLEDPEAKGYIFTDKIHPTNAGHQVIANEFRNTGYSYTQELLPILLSPTLKTPYSVSSNPSATIRTTLKASNGYYYLLTANSSNIQTTATFTFTFKVPTPVDKMFEGTQATASGVIITDSFAPLAVHIYKFPTGADADLDTFPDSLETYLGTNPNSSCSTVSHTDAFPPDVNADGAVTIPGDILPIARAVGKNSSQSDWATYKRYDLDGNGAITLQDVLIASKFFGPGFCP